MAVRRRRLCWIVGLLGLSGCLAPVRERVDLDLNALAERPVDAVLSSAADSHPPPPVREPESKLPPPRTLSERLKIPPEFPGAEAPPLKLPPLDKTQPEARARAFEKLYPSLPALPSLSARDANVQPLSLTDLQSLAARNSPQLRQARAHVEAARGAALQAGLYPNPTFGYEGDTAGTAGGPGYQGAFFEQTIKTGGKLKLAEAAAGIDLLNAQLAFRKAQADLVSQVRAGYFAVLVAEANLRISHALARFTDEVFRIQIEQVQGGQAAAYEPLQLRVLAMQARGSLVQAQNRYTAAWKQLAATLGLPAMPATYLAGSVELPIPLYHYDHVQQQVLASHTEVLTADNGVLQARYNLRRAQITPVPDVNVRVMVQKDFTGPPFEMTPSVAVSVPVPVWDRNQGHILQEQGNLLQAVEAARGIRNDLTGQLAEAFERYENNRILLGYYVTQILPDQVRAYRGVYERHQQEPEKVGFGDVINAQQVLVSTVTTYVTTLGAQWAAVVDIAHLLQADDLFQVNGENCPVDCVATVPDLDGLLSVPCRAPDDEGTRPPMALPSNE